MNTIMKTAFAATAIVAAAPASAAIVITQSPGAVQPEENVLFDVDQAVDTTVIGTTNNTNTVVEFVSDETLDVSGSSGQARIEGVDGSLDSLLVRLADDQFTFTEFEFNLFNPDNGTTSVTITLSDGTVQSFDLSPNGQNFFGIQATDGSTLTSVAFQTDGTGVADVRQVRIGGIASVTAAVPEPATWALLLLGFFGIGGMMRRTGAVRSLDVTYG